MQAVKKSCACKASAPSTKRRKALPLVFGLLVAILPKCPFCVLAWSSAITLCSGETMYNHTASWTSWISVGLALCTLLLVLWNYRGTRTLVAATFVAGGCVFLLRAEWITGNLSTYYLGATLLLGGVWVNGNLLPLIRQWGTPRVFDTETLRNENS